MLAQPDEFSRLFQSKTTPGVDDIFDIIDGWVQESLRRGLVMSVNSLNDKLLDEISAKTERVVEVESREAQELVHRLSYPAADKSPTEKLNEEHKQRDEEIKKQIADAWSGLSKHGGDGPPPK